MVRTRAQRVANDENGVAQSPPQALATPRRKTSKAKPLNASIKHATRDTIATIKSNDKSSGAEKSKQSRSKPNESSRTSTKKARLRNAARKVKSQTENNVALPEDLSDIENRESEDVENTSAATAVSKSERALLNTTKAQSKTQSKDTAQTGKPTKTAVNGDRVVDKALSIPFSASKPNGGLFDIFSRLSPQNLEAQSKRASSEGAASTSSEKETSTTSEQPKVAKTHKPKSKEQRALQEHGSNKQKPANGKSGSSLSKRKRVVDHNNEIDDEDAPEAKKKTARWSFKPDSVGNLALLPRANIDPDDDTVIFVEGQEALKLVSEEFERKKQVRFADRIAKQHSELSREEQAAQHAQFESQNLKVTTQGFFGNELPRNGDMRALARKLDAGHQTLLEKVENLTGSDDQELRDELARDLIELAYAIRAAGPQSADHSPVDQTKRLTWTNPQDDKENKSTATSPENSPPPAANNEEKGTHTATSTNTPGRIFASIRKLRSYLPFGGSNSSSAAPSPEKEIDDAAAIPDSPTPAPRKGNDTIQPNPNSHTSNKQPETQPQFDSVKQHSSEFTPSNAVVLRSENQNDEGAAVIQTQPKALPPATQETQIVTEKEDIGNKTPNGKQHAAADAITFPKTPDTHKGKIGSQAYPLTADGKIPRPAPGVLGLNTAYFYDAEDSDDSDEDMDARVIFRRRNLPKPQDRVSAKETTDNLRLTRSAPRPATSRVTFTRPTIKTPVPRVISAPELSDESDSAEDTPEMPSAERRDIERQKMRAERLKHSVDAHRPKTPSRLREMARAPQSPVDTRARLRKHFTTAGTQGVLNVFLHV